MCCKKFRLRVISFGLAFMLGCVAVSLLHREIVVNNNQEYLKSNNKTFFSASGSGQSGADTGEIFAAPDKDKSASVSDTKPVRIISKPRPVYTDAARQNQTQGTVTLRVMFMANGEVGSVLPVSGLPDGLTEQAFAAARAIKFEPAEKDGVTQTVTKQVQYSFTIY